MGEARRRKAFEAAKPKPMPVCRGCSRSISKKMIKQYQAVHIGDMWLCNECEGGG